MKMRTADWELKSFSGLMNLTLQELIGARARKFNMDHVAHTFGICIAPQPNTANSVALVRFVAISQKSLTLTRFSDLGRPSFSADRHETLWGIIGKFERLGPPQEARSRGKVRIQHWLIDSFAERCPADSLSRSLASVRLLYFSSFPLSST